MQRTLPAVALALVLSALFLLPGGAPHPQAPRLLPRAPSVAPSASEADPASFSLPSHHLQVPSEATAGPRGAPGAGRSLPVTAPGPTGPGPSSGTSSLSLPPTTSPGRTLWVPTASSGTVGAKPPSTHHLSGTEPGAQAPSVRFSSLRPAIVQTALPVWGQEGVVPTGVPYGAAMAQDPADGYLVYFGGNGFSNAPQPLTWVRGAAGWENLTGAQSTNPPACRYCSMAWYPDDQDVVLFDYGTWVFHAGRWAQANPSAYPPLSLTQESLAYDGVDHELVLEGGTYRSYGCTCDPVTNATWVFKTSDWQNVTTIAGTAPSARTLASMTWDQEDGYAVLFGGLNASDHYLLGDTWEFASNHWSALSVGGPLAREGAKMIDDTTDHGVVLYGGTGCNSTTWTCTDTWQYKADSWLELFPATSPFPEAPGLQVMAFDPTSGYAVLLEAGTTSGSFTTNESVPFSWPSHLVAALSASPASFDLPRVLSLHDASSGGIPPLTISWSGLPTGCASVNAPFLNCTPTQAGSWSVHATVTDAAGRSVTNVVALTVDPSLRVSNPSPDVPVVDAGGQVTFNITAYGGAGGYQYAWNAPAGLGCAGSSSSSVACTTTLAGRYSISVSVTDANLYTIVSNATTFQVSSGPTVTLAENRTYLDLGESVLFWANATGGTGTFTYTFSGLPTGCSSKNQSVLACSPQTSATGVTVSVTDSGGGSGTSNPVSFTVDPDPVLSSYWRPGSMVVNRSVGWFAYVNWSGTYEVNASGGTPSYDYCLVTAPSTVAAGCSGWTGVSSFRFAWFFIPAFGMSAGAYRLTFSVHDETGWNDTVVLMLDLYWPPVLGSPVAPSAVDEGETVAVSAPFVHGAPPVSFWINDTTSGLPLCSGSSALAQGSLGCSFTVSWVGSHGLNMTARDSLGLQRSSSGSLSTVSATVLSLLSSPSSAPVGRGFQIVVGVSGGTSPYLFCTAVPSWSYGPVCQATSPSTSGVFSYRGSSSGAVQIAVSVIDGAGVNRTLWTNVTIVPDLTGAALQSPSWSYDGTVVTLGGSFLNGAPDFTVWFNDTTISASICPQSMGLLGGPVTCAFTLGWSGADVLELTVRDAYGENATANATLTAYPALVIGSVNATTGLHRAITGGMLDTEVGGPVFLNASFSGGKGTRSYAWWVGTLLMSEGNGSASTWSATWVPSRAGTYLVLFDLVDASGTPQSVSITVQVLSGPGNATLQATPTLLDPGGRSTLSFSETEGTDPSGSLAPLGYSWMVESAPGTWWKGSTLLPTLSFQWSIPGTYEIVASAWDADHARTVALQNVSVASPLSLPCAPTLHSSHRTPGSPLNFTIDCLSGGIPTIQLLWSWGDGSTSSGTSNAASHTYAQPGNYTVVVSASDARSSNASSAALALSVVPVAKGGGGAAPSLNGWLSWPGAWGLLLVVDLAALAVLFAIWMRARRRSPPGGRAPVEKAPGGHPGEGEGSTTGEEARVSGGEEAKGASTTSEGDQVELQRAAEVDASVLRLLGSRGSAGLAELRESLKAFGLEDSQLLEQLFALKTSGKVVLLPESRERDEPVFALAPKAGTRGEPPQEFATPTIDEDMVKDFLTRRESAMEGEPGDTGVAEGK